MTWTEARRTPMRDIVELVSILSEWDRKRTEAVERARR